MEALVSGVAVIALRSARDVGPRCRLGSLWGCERRGRVRRGGAAMAVIRHDILHDAAARDLYVHGVLLLKNEYPGPTTTSFGIPGPSRKVSTWTCFSCGITSR